MVKTEVNLVDMLKNTMKNYALQIEESKATVLLFSEKDNSIVFADAEHLSAVFNNLLDNALKYSKDHCKIEIIVKEENDNINVIFNDNGIGIDMENKEKIFEKFYRVQAGDQHDIKGFGLGLSYAKSIIEAHGGTIDIKSEKGIGTELIIRFSCSS
jgi:two-component system phosphate regulon sensor histidine kinase PhoR